MHNLILYSCCDFYVGGLLVMVIAIYTYCTQLHTNSKRIMHALIQCCGLGLNISVSRCTILVLMQIVNVSVSSWAFMSVAKTDFWPNCAGQNYYCIYCYIIIIIRKKRFWWCIVKILQGHLTPRGRTRTLKQKMKTDKMSQFSHCC